jgi:hypothetical protein
MPDRLGEMALARLRATLVRPAVAVLVGASGTTMSTTFWWQALGDGQGPARARARPSPMTVADYEPACALAREPQQTAARSPRCLSPCNYSNCLADVCPTSKICVNDDLCRRGGGVFTSAGPFPADVGTLCESKPGRVPGGSSRRLQIATSILAARRLGR